MGNNEKPRWSPSGLYPELDDEQIAENLARFFNDISSKYSPLNMNEVPKTLATQLTPITEEDVIKKIKDSNLKPSSVPGDIPTWLYGLFLSLIHI